MRELGLEPLALGPKEGLALINGTQVSTAVALDTLFTAERVFASALISGRPCRSTPSRAPTPPSIRESMRRGGSRARSTVAAVLKRLLEGSEIRHSHDDCGRVQDPYSFRCQPQVMGACLDLLRNVSATLEIEANAVTDNPVAVPRERQFAVRRQFPCRTGGVRRRHSGDGDVRGGQHLGAADGGAGRSQDERPAALPGRGQRSQFGLHDRPGDGGGPGFRE